ncbi:MAG: hypothetical protein QM500_13975 [Methylococcales bacterium]
MIQEFKNALAITKQIKNNEWKFTGHYPYDFQAKFKCFTAERNGIELWVANGVFSCGIRDQQWHTKNFGWIIWCFAAKKCVKELEKRMLRKPKDLTA